MIGEDMPLERTRGKDACEGDRIESRRRLLKAGLVAVPFLVTLYALPARADGGGQGSLGMYGSGEGPGRGKGRGRGRGGGGYETEDQSGKRD